MRRHSQTNLKTIQSWKLKDLTTMQVGVFRQWLQDHLLSMLPFTTVIYFALFLYLPRRFLPPFQCASLAVNYCSLSFSPSKLLGCALSPHSLQRPLQPSRNSPPFPQILMHIPHLSFIGGGLVTADSPPPSKTHISMKGVIAPLSALRIYVLT